MPRGRHRHSPPLHRLLPPSAIAGVSVVCALGPWVFTEPFALRGLAAAAAATAVIGAIVMRRWDIQAGKQVADLTRARAGDEWRFEERVAELESDLDESRELRIKLEQRLRAKRAELAGLRNEHAALLRRYATAETERATALEGRRLLEIEAAPPSNALPPARAAETAEGAGTEGTSVDEVALDDVAVDEDALTEGSVDGASAAGASKAGVSASGAPGEGEPDAPAVFSADGSKLFLRALSALARFDADRPERGESAKSAESEPAQPAVSEPVKSAEPTEPVGPAKPGKPAEAAEAKSAKPPKAESAGTTDSTEPAEAKPASVAFSKAGGDKEAAREDEAEGKPEAVDEHTRAAAPPLDPAEDEAPAQTTAAAAPQEAAERTQATDANSTDANSTDGTHGTDATDTPEAPHAVVPARRPGGHFTVPTAVAVAPESQPVRRPTAEGGFDFFGTKESAASDALEAVQNEDLADVVGQEALALHKAETEAEFKPADDDSRRVGQVIDLTAHDETEQIDLHRLRSAVS
ncbi:hypothetical protein ABT142_26430 [Streptomyces sp. NPDC001857]|uniref:hypothetical protein n=1 Tax=unclassified Streptomyces TaxID=2593676 RepID=UPI00331A00A6